MLYDIYKIKEKNKFVEKKEKIIIFGNKDRLRLLWTSNYKEFFIDITFKIIPKKFRPHKLFTMATLDNNENKTILIRICIVQVYGLRIIY